MVGLPMLTVAEIKTALLDRHTDSACHVIGLDGFMGAGKTTLAFELAESLGGIRVSLDSYADRNADAEDYAARIMRRYLASDFIKLKSAFPFLIVEGICLFEVFAALSECMNSLVYVKRLSVAGIWHDGIHLEDYELSHSLGEGVDPLRKNVLEYHSKWRPHEKAHVVYERSEVNGS